MTGLTIGQEFTGDDDRYFDYCMWEYRPDAPSTGKHRSWNLLLNAFDAAGAAPRVAELCARLRAGIGVSRTVWGVKQAGGQLSWELYFYDYERLERELSIARVLDVLAPQCRCDLADPAQRPYFMFSIDIDDALARGERGLDEINVYLGNVGSEVSSGICYSMTERGLRMDNLYYFFDARRDMESIVAKLACSAHLDLPGLDVDAILWPELRDCKSIVVANKKHHEGVYFSGIDVDQLLFFLERMQYPREITGFVRRERARLDHLQYDVGLDYRMRDGKLEFLKSAYYGVF